ncbi:response regulator transcription factor [Streptomyces sp. NPDC046261]|uniref:response regulator transcription factor n=1 Tax=Streptomyces sp. NPDC046261 TaxID=3157200 RepID=UPI0033EC0D6E
MCGGVRSTSAAALVDALDEMHVALAAAQKLLAEFFAEHGEDGNPPGTGAQNTRGSRDVSVKQALSLLTPREREVLGLVAQGKSNRQVASSLEISEKTVKNHLSAVFSKVGAADRTQAVVFGIRGGLVRIGGAA